MTRFSLPFALFALSLVTGILLMVVTAIGGVGDGHDADADHDVDHGADADQDHDAGFGRALSALGVGRAPLTLVLVAFFSLFGAVGLGLGLVLSEWLALVASLAAATFLTGRLARLFSRLLPRTESYGASSEDLCGCIGTAVYGVTGSEGMVQVRDQRGAIQKVSARTSGGERIPTGADVVVVSYDEGGDRFLVTRAS